MDNISTKFSYLVQKLRAQAGQGGNHHGWRDPGHREESERHRWGGGGLGGVRRALTCFVPAVNTLLGHSVGVPIVLSTPDVFLFEFHPPSKSGSESPDHREGSGCKTKHCWGLGGAGSVSPSKSGPESPLFPS